MEGIGPPHTAIHVGLKELRAQRLPIYSAQRLTWSHVACFKRFFLLVDTSNGWRSPSYVQLKELVSLVSGP